MPWRPQQDDRLGPVEGDAEKKANESGPNRSTNRLGPHASRVKGQEPIIEDVAKLLRLQSAKRTSDRPIANLLFLGPTGTGKTELAKAIAEYLYQDEKAMLRFDCSEFTGPEAKTP
jgi:ATP-dependent Clp protease ATP-binding subunit ClpA